MTFCWRALCSSAFILACLAMIARTPALAQDLPAEAPAEHVQPASLKILNRPIVSFRSKFMGYAPVDRVASAQRRFNESTWRGGPGEVAVHDEPQGTVVTYDGVLLFIVTPGDVEGTPEETPRGVATAAADTLRRVVDETREARDLAFMTRAAAEAAAVIVLCLVVVLVLLRTRRALQRRIGARIQRAAEERVGEGASLLRLDGAVAFFGWFMLVAVSGVALLVVYSGAVFVLGCFPYTRPWSEQLDQFFFDLAVSILSAVVDAAPDLVVAFVIFWLARMVIQVAGSFFNAVHGDRLHMSWIDPETARPTQRIVSTGIWLFALVMAYPYLPGTDTEAFKGISVLVGIMVSMGGSSVVAHAGSGLILMYTRTYRSGEYVRIGEQEGTVVQVGTFSTRLRTGLGEEVVIPNAVVIGAVTKNYSRAVEGRGFVLDTTVTIGYDKPWRQVEAMLFEAARRTEGISNAHPPRVFQPALADVFVEYRLVCVAIPEKPLTRAQVLTQLHQHILDVFNEHGVQIMSPGYEGDPDEKKVVAPEQWFAAPAVKPAAAEAEPAAS